MATDASISELLTTLYTAKAISTVAATSSPILGLFGFNGNDPKSDGKNLLRVGKRKSGWDIFDDTRTAASFRSPAAPAATVARNPVGRVEIVFPRMAEKLPLLHDDLNNFRKIGGGYSDYDPRGIDYITKQQRYLGQRAANFRLLMTAGMMRGNLYGHQVGDTTYYDFDSTAAINTISWRIPTGNTLQLNMTGAGNILDASWATIASTDIPRHLSAINAAFEYTSGSRLDVAVINSKTWDLIKNNTLVQRQAGSSNRVFKVDKRDVGMGFNGKPLTNRVGEIDAANFVEFIITDAVMDVGPPHTLRREKLIPDNYAWFGPQPDKDLMEMLIGSEVVSEGHGKAPSEKYGTYAYSKENDDPAVVELYSGDNACPALYVPAATAWAQVVF